MVLNLLVALLAICALLIYPTVHTVEEGSLFFFFFQIEIFDLKNND